ncbi:aspartyl protease APCB1 [Nymphaea colorata]|nr:aspartyl protease APCB1 [Nymphaea colorata]
MEPRIKGVVVISLPPEDDPSKGKTITAAFTLAETSSAPTHQNQSDRNPPIQERQMGFPPRKVFKVKRVMSLLGVAVLMFFLWQNGLSEIASHFEDDGSEEKKDDNSFVYTLYPKYGRGVEQDVALRLGRAIRRDEVRNRIIADNFAGVPSTNSSTIFPVKGNVYPDGLYYISILVGNPPKPYYLDMDTGSDLTWIQCDAPCTSCAKGPHPLYRPSKGKIVPPKDSLCIELQVDQNHKYCDACHQCDYEMTYADQGSSMGVLTRDSLLLMIANGTLTRTTFVFGCAYDQQGPLLVSPAKTDGILGLSNAKISLPSQLASQGIVKNVVGHCISSDIKAGGYMFFGDDSVPSWGMNWVPMLSNPSLKFYHSEILKISIGGQQLDFKLGDKFTSVVFDSGSSYTYFTNEAYKSLIASLKYITSNGFVLDESDTTLPVCWQAKAPVRSVDDVKQFFKPLTLQLSKKWLFGSKEFEIPPESYLVINGKGNVCLGILDGSKVHDGKTFILGDISLRGKLVVYDNVKKRIGWVDSDCSKPPKFKSFPFI